MNPMNPKEMNTTALAYIGDAVYEIYVREHVLETSKAQAFGAHVDVLHKKAVRYVRADGQAKALRRMLKDGFLTAEEEALVRRARNHKSASKPKNADAMDYKYATALEALIGYWRLTAGSFSDTGDAVLKSSDPDKQKNAVMMDPAADVQLVDKAETRMEEIIFKAFSLIEKG